MVGKQPTRDSVSRAITTLLQAAAEFPALIRDAQPTPTEFTDIGNWSAILWGKIDWRNATDLTNWYKG